MTAPTQINQITQGIDRLLGEFKDKPNIEATLTTYLTQKNDEEDVWFQLLNERGILSTAIGAQLDLLGKIVVESRNGLNDTDYREAILTKVQANSSEGTPEDILALLKLFTNSTLTRIWEHYPASYNVSYDGDDTPANLLKNIVNASILVNVGIMHDQNNAGWAPSELGATGDAARRGVLPEFTQTSGSIIDDVGNFIVTGTGDDIVYSSYTADPTIVVQGEKGNIIDNQVDSIILSGNDNLVFTSAGTIRPVEFLS